MWRDSDQVPQPPNRVRTAILYSSTEADAVATAADGDNDKPRQQFKDVDVMKRGVGERVFLVAEADN